MSSQLSVKLIKKVASFYQYFHVIDYLMISVTIKIVQTSVDINIGGNIHSSKTLTQNCNTGWLQSRYQELTVKPTTPDS
jgi:hypothetical protein